MADPNEQASKPIDAAHDALTVRRVFGESYEADGATGMGRDPKSETGGPNAEGTGGGGGFGVCAQPAGVFVIRDGEVTWKPALDLNLAILGGQVLAGIIAVAAACTARSRAKLRARELVFGRALRG